jgi:hypothetical protein
VIAELKAPENVSTFRAHLIVASAAAMLIQSVALTAIYVAGVPEHFFELAIFRLVGTGRPLLQSNTPEGRRAVTITRK